MRILFTLLLALTLLFPLNTSHANVNNPINVEVNGKTVVFSGQGAIFDGTKALMPARAVFEKIGFKLNWTQATNTLSGSNGPISISLTANNEVGSLNSKPVLFEYSPKIIANTFMITPETITQLLMYSSRFDSNAQVVRISTTSFANLDPYDNYNRKYGGLEIAKNFVNKTNWIKGPLIITDLTGKTAYLQNLSAVWIERAEKEDIKDHFKLFVKSANKQYIIRYLNNQTLLDSITFVNPFTQYKWSTAVWNNIKQRKAVIGMNKEMVAMAIGKPTTINTSQYAWGAFEQWVYPTSTKYRSDYVYFKNGILSSIQTSK